MRQSPAAPASPASAENLGYAKVVLEQTIAQGAAGCRVVVYWKPQTSDATGREYHAGST